ncbi:F0F1 ATP synthase subunit delta [Methylophilaceae bacterium]|nr:F0F1 ATP synthase subunit delta [Methylophilaceae bacterium]
MAEISTIARPYATAVFNFAKESKGLSNWSDTLVLLSAVIQDEHIKSIIEDSKVLDSEREDLILNVCKGKLDENGSNFVKLLVENKRLLILPEISLFFEELKAEAEGTIEAEIIMAEKPTQKTVDDLLKSLEKKFNKKIEGKVVIDKNIIGGTKIVVGDSVIDASVRAQLDNLAFTLKA